MKELIDRALTAFCTADNFGRGLTANQIGLKPPATHDEVKKAFREYGEAGFDLNGLVEEMEAEIGHSRRCKKNPAFDRARGGA
jgi:hypothetical protein